MSHEIGLTGLAVCSNGAIVYDVKRDKIIDHTPIASEAAHRIIVSLREAAPGVCFMAELGIEYGWETAYLDLRPGARTSEGIERDALMLCDAPVTKLIALHAELSADELLEIVAPLVADFAHATHSGSPFVEMSAAGIHKAWALKRLSSRLGIHPSEVIAFGDMPNDLPMLFWAGHSVAVANAHPDVLVACDEVTFSNEKDGVAAVLERLL